MSVPAGEPPRPDGRGARSVTPRQAVTVRAGRSTRASRPIGPGSGTPPTQQAPGPRPPRRRGPTQVHPRPGHIPGLDGLRAIAVVGVLVFHFLPSTLPGGFLGVDVFFVVSGFLITTLLLREIDAAGRIDLVGFWRRRARRLLPALLLVVVTSVTAARLIGEDLLVGIGRQTVGALTFTSNWVEVAAGASYFHSTSPILFVNFWSLAVEEQFYLLWPLTLVLVLAATATTRARLQVVGGIGLASAVLMALLYTPGQDPTRVYYGTDTHLMGLMAGAALALAWADPRHRAGLRSAWWRRWRGTAVLASLLVLGGSMRWLSFDSSLPFRGGILVASLATVVLIAGLLETPSAWRRVMSVPLLTWVGERSYGIYLWHWPVLVIAGALVPYAAGTLRAGLVLLTALLVTLLLSELSLRLVERPVRRRGLRASVRRLLAWTATPWQVNRVPRIIAGGLAVLVLGTAAAVATAPEKSATQRLIEESQTRIDAETGREGAPAAQEPDLVPEEEAVPEQGTQEEPSAPDQEAPAQGPTASDLVADDDGLLVPRGEDLSAFGDSLVVTSADGLRARFPGITFAALSNRQWRDAEAALTEALDSGAVRDNVVLHLGTNAGVDEDGLRSALDRLGPDRRVVVMNLYLSATFTDASNATIEQVVADHPNAVVGDWRGAVLDRPGMLQSDNVHPDLDGMHVYAEVVARAFDELARREG